MSAASCRLTEDQFLCSICLDVFTDPVSTPCGHNFCKKCITHYWDVNTLYDCPICKEVFIRKPEPRVNTFISEMVAQFRQSAQQEASSISSEQHVSKPGEVPCDICTGTKVKALKSCLVCLASYCDTHLEPHLNMSALKRHQLIDPVENLESRLCEQHDKLLELFCKNDQMCVCLMCTYSDHRTHDVVPLKEEYEGKKAELGKTEADIQQMIQKRRLKIEEIKKSEKLGKRDADREKAEGVQVFTGIIEDVQSILCKLIDTIQEKQRETEKQTEGFIRELQQEISELEKTRFEVEQLSRTEDHLHLLQNFTSLNTAPLTKDWTGVMVLLPSYEGDLMRAVEQLKETITAVTLSDCIMQPTPALLPTCYFPSHTRGLEFRGSVQPTPALLPTFSLPSHTRGLEFRGSVQPASALKSLPSCSVPSHTREPLGMTSSIWEA